MKASLIIPTYNHKELTRACLTSLNHQIVPEDDDFEVIVIDDGSTDGTESMVAQLSPRYDLRYFYKPRTKDSSRSAARNDGIAKASGDVLIFLDSDHVVQPDFVKEHLRIHKLQDDLVCVGFRYFLHDGEVDVEGLDEVFSLNCLPDIETFDERIHLIYMFSENLNVMKTHWFLFWTCNVSVGKKHMEDVGGFDEQFVLWGLEDNEVGFKLHQKGLTFVYNHHLPIYHQYHPRNMKENQQQWSENLNLFLSKHKDTEAEMVKLFARDLNVPWFEQYLQFEYASRALQRRSQNRPVQLYEIGAPHSELFREIKEKGESHRVLIVDQTKDYNENVLLQTLDTPHDLYYFKGDRELLNFMKYHAYYRGELNISHAAFQE